MNLLSTATPETSPLSQLSPSSDGKQDFVPNPKEILQMDKRGMSDVSLSTRLALRKNNEPTLSTATSISTGSAPRKRGRPKKNFASASATTNIQPKSTKSINISSDKSPTPKILSSDISAIVENLDKLFKPVQSLIGPKAFISSSLKFTEMVNGVLCSPLVSQNNIANIGILKIQPSTHYGPYVNVQRGFIVLIILNSEPGKITFDSGHDNLGPASCDNNTQLMVCPNDMFMLHNTSDSIEAEVLMILCHSLGNDLDHLKDIKYAY